MGVWTRPLHPFPSRLASPTHARWCIAFRKKILQWKGQSILSCSNAGFLAACRRTREGTCVSRACNILAYTWAATPAAAPPRAALTTSSVMYVQQLKHGVMLNACAPTGTSSNPPFFSPLAVIATATSPCGVCPNTASAVEHKHPSRASIAVNALTSILYSDHTQDLPYHLMTRAQGSLIRAPIKCIKSSLRCCLAADRAGMSHHGARRMAQANLLVPFQLGAGLWHTHTRNRGAKCNWREEIRCGAAPNGRRAQQTG